MAQRRKINQVDRCSDNDNVYEFGPDPTKQLAQQVSVIVWSYVGCMPLPEFLAVLENMFRCVFFTMCPLERSDPCVHWAYLSFLDWNPLDPNSPRWSSQVLSNQSVPACHAKDGYGARWPNMDPYMVPSVNLATSCWALQCCIQTVYNVLLQRGEQHIFV